MAHLNPKVVIDQIVNAFQSVQRPRRCVPQGYIPYGEDEELEYLEGKAWMEIANDVHYIRRASSFQLYSMKRECLFYLLPGYMICSILNPIEAFDGVASILSTLFALDVRQTSGSDSMLRAYIFNRLNTEQQSAIRNWLAVMLDLEKQLRPESYTRKGDPTWILAAARSWGIE